MSNQLQTGRILSIDVLRGFTILTMIFVNELAGISDVPIWMKHMPADADAMTFVDIVFPSFLFIVGLSIPFALDARLKKEKKPMPMVLHIFKRFTGLLVVGFFMVNSDSAFYDIQGTNQNMVITIGWWSLIMYIAVVLVWNDYKKWGLTSIQKKAIQFTGIAVLFLLFLLYRNQEGGRMGIQWWGILGLIGWAYLFSCLTYLIYKGNKWLVGASIIAFIGLYMVCQLPSLPNSVKNFSGNFTHTATTLSGIFASLVLFNQQTKEKNKQILFLIFILVCFVLGYLLRPYYSISKIWATPTWVLYSVGICSILLYLLYGVIEKLKLSQWTTFFQPAASNPLLIYLIPYILISFCIALGVDYRPAFFDAGTWGIVWSMVFSIVMMWLVKLLNRFNIYLKL